MEMKRIAIITARGGSKRIPRKNILPFNGQPIITYSIKAAIESGLFDEVMVSTDDDEIAAVAKECGAKIPFMRSEATSNDFANTEDVLREVIEEYGKRGITFESMCCIYPTAPFISAERLKEAVEKFEASDAETLLPVVRFSYPPQRGLVIKEDYLVFNQPEFMQSRSQDLEKMYHDVGQFYIMNTEAFLKNGAIMKGKIIPFEIPELEVQDIDDMTDWKLAEIKYQLLKGKE